MEIMVSLAVLAIALATLFKLQSSTVDLAQAGHFKSSAPILARQVLAGMAESDFNPDDTKGEFTQEFEGIYWESQIQTANEMSGIEDFLSDEQADRLKKISITVHSPGQGRRFTLETWRFTNADP